MAATHEPGDTDHPAEPDHQPDIRYAHMRTICFTCRGTGTIWRHLASNNGQTAVPQTCPQCEGEQFLPGFQAPV